MIDPLLARLSDATRNGTSRFVSFFDQQYRGVRALASGQLQLAEAMLRGALERCAELTDRALERSATADLATVLTRIGRLDEADALIAGVSDADLAGLRFAECSWWTRRAELRAAQGRWAEVIADLRRVEHGLDDWGWNRFPMGRSGALMARATAERGDLERGRALAEKTLAEARRRAIPGDEAAAQLALVYAAADPDSALVAATAATQAAARSRDLVVRAEASLALGSCLRRAGQRKEARSALAHARETASRAGAASLLDRATEEYVVAGGRPQRVAASGVGSLTPSERRTAEAAAAGLTNREIAERLFVTRKTVEFTLGRVFQKLEISSRAQLPQHLSAAQGDQPG